MNSIKDDINNRVELTDLLEHIFFKKALDVFWKKNPDKEFDRLGHNWKDYSSFITRTWLNYLDTNQFKKVVRKKVKDKIKNYFYNNRELL